MNPPGQSLKNRNWLITGASSGIGAALALLLAPTAATMVLSGRNANALGLIADQARELSQGAVAIVTMDLARPGAGHNLAREALSICPQIDGLINAAGAAHATDVADLAPLDLETELACNARAIQELVHHLAPGMMDQKMGWILNIASIAGFFGIPSQSTYSATKSWLVSFGSSLYYEFIDRGVVMTTICPGATTTQFMERANVDMTRRWVRHTLWQTPEEVATFALKALSKKKMIATPSWRNRFMIGLARFFPRPIVSRLVCYEMEVPS